MHRFPSEDWTAAYMNALNTNARYQEAGRAWTFGAVAMIVKSDLSLGIEHDIGMVLDVHQGQCRRATFIAPMHDDTEANFVIAASYERWKEVIEGKLDPMRGMMAGKLRLRKGHLPTIIRFVESARQLVVSASRVPTEFLH